MKRKFISLALAATTISLQAQEQNPPAAGQQIDLTVSFGHDKIGGIKKPKAPIQPPYVTLDDHTLYIWSQHNGYTVTLLDDNGTVVCQTYVAAGMQYAVLQSTLSGSFVLQLSDDTYLFTGMIALD